MTAKKMIHYNIDNLMQTGALFNLLYGERSNGKSYQVKHKIMFKDSVVNGDRRFMLVRRSDDEITNSKLERYFDDVNIEAITDGKYNCISIYRKEIFLSTYDIEKNKTVRGKKIGYAVALQREQYLAGASFLDVDDIIFEEFMVRDRPYLYQEPDKLMNLFCTVDRKRGSVRVWLVGNTISRVCPYLYDWDLYDIVRKQEQGTIAFTDRPVDEYGTTIKLAIEHCKATGQTSFTLGAHAAMLNTGEWQSDRQPHLPYSYKECDLICRVIFQYSNFSFIGEYLRHGSNKLWYIYPKTRPEIYGYIYVFSDQIRPEKTWARDPYHSNTKNPILQRVFNDFREDKIFYSTDLDGTEFKQCIDFEIKK